MSTQTSASISLAEYAERRSRLSALLNGSIGIVFAGDSQSHGGETFRPHPHFAYLTGVTAEPGAILLLDPSHPVKARREVLFLRPLNPELEKWDGLRLEISKALRDATGFQSIFRADQFGRFLNEAARRAKSLACLHPLAAFDQPVSPDLAVFRKLQERIPGASIVDCSETIGDLRSVKSPAEIEMIQKAVDITAAGFADALRVIRPGASEFEVQDALHHSYHQNGSRGPAFGTIVGSGVRGTVLHYRANAADIADGDLVVIDTGAAYGPDGCSYGGDVTRTFPAGGTISPRQRQIYDVAHEALKTATAAARPGATLAEIDQLARAVITKAGFGDYFIHSIGHHLGLETHDSPPSGGVGAPLREGNVITIEPGIYIPEEKIGVRIEDDVLITKSGPRILSEKIPSAPDDVEAAMRAAR